MSLCHGLRWRLLAMVGWFFCLSTSAFDDAALLRATLELACQATSRHDIDKLGERLPDADPDRLQTASVNLTTGRRRIITLPEGTLTVDWVAPKDHLHHIRVQFDIDERPTLLAIVDSRCQLRAARRLRYDAAGRPLWLEHSGEDFTAVERREPLNPPAPARPDPGGVPVALVDTGVNYLLPALNARLARDATGGLLGYDYWDLDRRPFDLHPTRSPFYPERHGTQIASLLTASPVVKLLPYRYPRLHMARMRDLVEAAAAAGVRLVNVSLVSRHRDDWLPFREAAARHPEILFIAAAGNRRRNIDRRPVYPASFELDNLVVVTAATAGGELADGMNWGPLSVDLLVPGEDIEVTDFDGQARRVTGSSYATAQVTALAACLLAEHPDWQTGELKTALFRLAQPSPREGVVARGFISNPTLSQSNSCVATDSG